MYSRLSAKINIRNTKKLEWSAEGETFIGFSTATAVTADSDSVVDTVGTVLSTVTDVTEQTVTVLFIP